MQDSCILGTPASGTSPTVWHSGIVGQRVWHKGGRASSGGLRHGRCRSSGGPGREALFLSVRAKAEVGEVSLLYVAAGKGAATSRLWPEETIVKNQIFIIELHKKKYN